MSGERERYHVLMSPSAYKRYRKFDPHLQRKIKEEAGKLSEDPYRIVGDKNRIEIVLVKSRESFYQILR